MSLLLIITTMQWLKRLCWSLMSSHVQFLVGITWNTCPISCLNASPPIVPVGLHSPWIGITHHWQPTRWRPSVHPVSCSPMNRIWQDISEASVGCSPTHSWDFLGFFCLYRFIHVSQFRIRMQTAFFDPLSCQQIQALIASSLKSVGSPFSKNTKSSSGWNPPY